MIGQAVKLLSVCHEEADNLNILLVCSGAAVKTSTRKIEEEIVKG